MNNRLPNDFLERSGIFVTCQIGDDVPYLIKSCMGENTLMIGTDYGHADSSTELDALTTLKNSGGITPGTAQENRRRQSAGILRTGTIAESREIQPQRT